MLRATSDRVARLVFSANALRINGARVEGAAGSVSSGKERVVFYLAHTLRKRGEVPLRFRIDGTPARDVTMMPGGIYTGCFAGDWMVCLEDAPGDETHPAIDPALLALPPCDRRGRFRARIGPDRARSARPSERQGNEGRLGRTVREHAHHGDVLLPLAGMSRRSDPGRLIDDAVRRVFSRAARRSPHAA
ncbi:hypothetical protein [Sphingomonas lenta]|uniref:hypothetical protein n=1 Tax=Sphingomonas lenta TaxID=1141887 RepID=UPI001140E3EB|nr:hypothetical protein [Sphingomonas lenta]